MGVSVEVSLRKTIARALQDDGDAVDIEDAVV